MDNQLRKTKSGHQLPWTKVQVLAGLNHFFGLYERYPTAQEIDIFEFLPSSRSIQRQFGGLVALRQELIPNSESDFTRGEYRSSRAHEVGARAKVYEEVFYDFLCTHFLPIAVHEHKIMRPGNVACDYYIYLDESSGVVIDLFYAQDLRSTTNVINIKLKRYSSLPHETYLILMSNDGISFEALQALTQRRRMTLPSHITIDLESHFMQSTVMQLKKRSEYSR